MDLDHARLMLIGRNAKVTIVLRNTRLMHLVDVRLMFVEANARLMPLVDARLMSVLRDAKVILTL